MAGAQDILIVDDEADIRSLISGVLEDEGYAPRQAANDQEAFAAVALRRPDLIILDIWLKNSRLDGLGILEKIIADHPHLPILMISGHGTIETAVQAIKRGAYDFIEKPFEPNRILDSVRGCINALASLRPEIEAREAATARLATLTPRERQVFDALIRGRSNKEIALDLDISPRTVEIFRAKVMQKMQADSLSALVRMGLRIGDA